MSIIKLFLLVIFSVCLLNSYCLGQKATSEREKIQNIVKANLLKFPQMEFQDVYKLIHQASFGSAHAVLDSAMASEWMETEWNSLDTCSGEQMIDTISADGSIVRVNLRPYKQANLSKASLLSAFVNTANKFKGSKKIFEKNIKYVLELKSFLPYQYAEIINFLKKMKQKGYPAVHHTQKYEDLYKPAYRVILSKELK
jgi:hypothetical protein